jgi:hypothetical protein
MTAFIGINQTLINIDTGSFIKVELITVWAFASVTPVLVNTLMATSAVSCLALVHVEASFPVTTEYVSGVTATEESTFSVVTVLITLSRLLRAFIDIVTVLIIGLKSITVLTGALV